MNFKSSGSLLSLLYLTTHVAVIYTLLSCAPKEKLESLYEPENYSLETITLNIASIVDNIPPVEPTGLRRTIYKIPLLNRFLAIPLDLTNNLLPPLPYNEYLELTEEDVDIWSSQEFLSLVQSLKLRKGWLREKSKEEVLNQGLEPGKKKSFLCGKKGLEFIKSIGLVFEYTDARFKDAPVYKIPLAYTNNSKKYFNKEDRIMHFETQDVDVRPFIDDFRNFRLKLETKGGFPCVKTYLQVGFEVEVKVKVPVQP